MEPNELVPSLLQAATGVTWLTFSATFLQAPKGFKLERSCEKVLSHLVQIAAAQLMDTSAAALVLFGVGRRGKEGRGMKGEKSHVRGCVFLNFSLCLLLTDQSKRELKEKNHIVPEKQNGS